MRCLGTSRHPNAITDRDRIRNEDSEGDLLRLACLTAGAEPSDALGRGLNSGPKESSMSIQRFETGPRMSQVVVHGNTVYLAGVVAQKTAGESVTKQTEEILSIIDGHLAKAGTDKSKLLTANIYITDMKTFGEMNAVWDGWVSPGNTPARATVEAKLAAPQFTVEIMVVAAK